MSFSLSPTLVDMFDLERGFFLGRIDAPFVVSVTRKSEVAEKSLRCPKAWEEATFLCKHLFKCKNTTLQFLRCCQNFGLCGAFSAEIPHSKKACTRKRPLKTSFASPPPLKELPFFF